jgi:hypothetical protein
MYLDATNLYGHSMSDYLPQKDFIWLTNNEIENLDILDISDTADTGFILEVDLEYPQNLHNSHNDFPFCPENIVPPEGKFPKLIPNLCDKVKYIIHYKNLKQCLSHWLILKKFIELSNFINHHGLKNTLI